MSSMCVFRADANAEIGSGHFMRSLSLAAEWVKRGNRAVIAGRAPEELVRRAVNCGVDHRTIAGTDSVEDDAPLLISICSELSTQIVCIDGYQFSPKYVERVRSSGVPVIEFTDGPIWSDYQSDLLLDQNLGAEKQIYEIAEHTRELKGVKYACLAPQFIEQSGGVRSTSGETLNVLVSMGGADPQNATVTILNALLEIDESMTLTVTVGISNPQQNEIAELMGQFTNGRVLVDAQNMSELMASSDIAIVAAGSTSWELAFMGVPALLTSVADNQVSIAEQLHEAGAAVDLGRIENLPSESLTQNLITLIRDRDLRSQMSLKGRGLVDGKGASRVVVEMQKLVGPLA